MSQLSEQSVGLVKTQTVTFDRQLKLESGRLLGPITLAYETYGTLNAERSNCVWVCHAWTGDAHAAGRHQEDDRKPGWWDDMIGPGKPIDTDRYFVVCSNVIGSCYGTTGPTSIDPKTNRPYRLQLPVIMIQDMVRAQQWLRDDLGIEKTLAVIGGSMGAMQALTWGVHFPQHTGAVIAIAGAGHNPPMAISLNALARQAIYNDPLWKKGNYRPGHQPADGLALARAVGHISFLSDASMDMKFGRRFSARDGQFDFFGQYEVERYLEYNGGNFVDRFDTNSFLYLAKALDLFDIGWGFVDGTEEALAEIQCPTQWFAFTSDWLYPPALTEQLVKVLQQQGQTPEYHLIESDYGHDSFLVEPEKFTPKLRAFLNRLLAGDSP